MNPSNTHIDTEKQVKLVFETCRDVFCKKLKDYGVSWRIMRPESITDQIFIKANRIRSIQLTGESLVDDSIESDFMAIVNYGIMGIIQNIMPPVSEPDISEDKAISMYDQYKNRTIELLIRKNHDYGEAWRSMRVSSLVDLILTKVYRTKHIETNDGQTIISEGIDSNYMDMVNYAIFAIIKINEK